METSSVPTQAILSQTSEHSSVLEQLGVYRELSQQCERYSKLLDNAERNRETVRSSIYEKVKEEYYERRGELEQMLQREQANLLGKVSRFLQEREDLRSMSSEAWDRLEEMEFRVRVGEFPEEDLSEEMKTLKRTIQEQERSAGYLEEILGKCRELGLAGQGDSGPSIWQEKSGAPVEEACSEPGKGVEREPAVSSTGTVWDGSPPPQAMCQEDSFVVVDKEQAAAGQDCPVVHCPEAFPSDPLQATPSQGNSSSSKAPSNGFISGYLCALEGSRKGTRFPLICSDITLGKSPGIDIRLLDSGIANFHARIVYKGRKYFLENLDPMGRSFVNGVQADIVELKDSDLIRLGEIKMRVEFGNQTAETLGAQAA